MSQFDNHERNDQLRRLGDWGAPIAGILVVLVALLGISVSQAEATDGGEEVGAEKECNHAGRGRWRHHRGGHRFFGHGSFGHRSFGHRGHDAERAREHMQYAAGWMLARLEVEDDVQDRVQARLEAAFDELAPLIEEHMNTHESFAATLLGADEVDRDELEVQRQAAMAAADRTTSIVTHAFADIAAMLSPAQREQIAERLGRHHR